MALRAFGRKLRVTISSPRAEQTTGFVFESDLLGGTNKRGYYINGVVKKYFAVQPPEATISIWNLKPSDCAEIIALRNSILDEQTGQYSTYPLKIKIEAGYKDSLFGTIFEGEILKPNMLKPDPVNRQLRLTCLDGYSFASASVLTTTFEEGMNYYDIARYVAYNGNLSENSIYLSEKLKDYKVEGSFVVSKSKSNTFNQIAENTGMIYSFNDGNASISTIDELFNSDDATSAWELNKDTGLIGIPALTNDGITAQSLLNPNINIYSIVRINNAEISIDQPDYLANRELGAWLSKDGTYRVIELQHSFDTISGVFNTNMRCLSRDYYDRFIASSKA